MQLMNSLLVVGLSIVFTSSAFAGNWTVHASELRAKIAEMQQIETDIEAAIKQKNSKKDGESAAAIDKIVEKHKELEKTAEEYKKIRNHVRFEHPEQGDSTERRYRPFRVKSIEEFEEAVGIYGKLDQIQRKLQKVYNVKKEKPKIVRKIKKEKEDLDTEVPRVKLSVE